MARIRAIKPELPSDGTLATCSWPARYLFILIISQSDDYGLLEARPRQILGALYPHDAAVTERQAMGWVEELVTAGRIRWRETVDGSPVLEVVNWTKHQMVKNPGKPLLRSKLLPLGSEPPPILPPSSVKSTAGRGQASGGLGGADRERDLGKGEGKGTYGLTAELEDFFRQCWDAYPRRPNNSRAKARDAWITSIKRGASPDAMLQGTKAYAAYVDRERIEARFIKQGATFFGPKEHWLDDYGPVEQPFPPMYLPNGEFNPAAAAALGVPMPQ